MKMYTMIFMLFVCSISLGVFTIRAAEQGRFHYVAIKFDENANAHFALLRKHILKNFLELSGTMNYYTVEEKYDPHLTLHYFPPGKRDIVNEQKFINSLRVLANRYAGKPAARVTVRGIGTFPGRNNEIHIVAFDQSGIARSIAQEINNTLDLDLLSDYYPHITLFTLQLKPGHQSHLADFQQAFSGFVQTSNWSGSGIWREQFDCKLKFIFDSKTGLYHKPGPYFGPR